MRKKSTSAIVISSVSTIIILIVALLVWPRGGEEKETPQSNPVDPDKTQIKILAKRINIRKEPTVESEDIGDVYSGEIYTVLDDLTKDDYYWYNIETSNGINGYIASNKTEEYVSLISGYIDRTPPVIDYDKPFIVFNEGVEDLSSITCRDEYSECELTINKVNNLYLELNATDEKGNVNTKQLRYYNAYQSGNYFYERNSNFTVNYTRSLDNNGLLINVTYTLNKQIPNEDKSLSYSTFVSLFDENFNELNYLDYKYNSKPIDKNCINDNRMLLKEEYANSNLGVSDKICFNFYVSDASKVKYFDIGIQGVENYEKENNYLNNYSSRLYIK